MLKTLTRFILILSSIALVLAFSGCGGDTIPGILTIENNTTHTIQTYMEGVPVGVHIQPNSSKTYTPQVGSHVIYCLQVDTGKQTSTVWLMITTEDQTWVLTEDQFH